MSHQKLTAGCRGWSSAFGEKSIQRTHSGHASVHLNVRVLMLDAARRGVCGVIVISFDVFASLCGFPVD